MSQNDLTDAIPMGFASRSNADAVVVKRPAETPPESQPLGRLSRRWLMGVVALVAVGATGIGAQVFLLSKAVSLEAEKAAWQATLEQRREERDGVDASIAKARAALNRVKAEIGVADQDLASRQTVLAEMEAARREAAAAQQLVVNATAGRDRALAAKAEVEQHLTELQALIAATKGEKEHLDGQRTNLLTEVASAQSQLRDVKSGLAERDRVEAQAEILRREVSQLSARRDTLQTEVGGAETLSAELKAAQQEVAALRGDKAALNLRVSELKKEQQDLETQKMVSDTAASVSLISEQNSETKSLTARKRCDELEQERTALESKLRDLAKTLAGVEGELRAKQVIADQLNDVEMKLDQRKAELKAAEDNVVRTRAATTQPGNTELKPAPRDGEMQ